MGKIRQAADNVGAASWQWSQVGQQVSTLITDFRKAGEIAMAVDVGPLEKFLKFRIELPKGKP